ncbi:MAG: YXWGXW repeat-containing protein [Acidobacteriaceae bacterium]|nr:YXWGXW repeat-containing protein [Acidobacteriaceae bacterium]
MQFSKVRRRTVHLMIAAGVVMTTLLLTPVASFGAIDISIGISVGAPPPVLPVYAQPMIPGPGYIWTPGYWAWGPGGYYWVPGVWVMPPAPGMLWTPPYWGWSGGRYIFNPGYWGMSVGYYGGVNYGYGYGGSGYDGGYWNNGIFMYNRSVNRLSSRILGNSRYVYNRPVSVINRSRVSYNGGKGGLTYRPSAREQSVANQRRSDPIASQVAHEQAMRGNRNQLANTKGGPQTRAMSTTNARPAVNNTRPAATPARPAATPARPAATAVRPAATPARPAASTVRPAPAATPARPAPTANNARPAANTAKPAPAANTARPAAEDHQNGRKR